ERGETDDRRRHGHDHRPQAVAAAAADGFQAWHALAPQQVDVIDHHDAVVHHHAHEDEDDDHRHERERGPGEREEEEHARDREHDAEQDADRLQHGLEYAGHHDEDEQHREQHVLQHEVLGLFVAVEAFAELPVVTGRQVHGFHEFLDLRLHGFHGRAIREPGVEAHRGSAVVARDARRTAHNLEVRDRGKRDALALLCQQRNVFQVADALLALAAEGKDHVDFTRRRAELAQVVTAHGHGNGTRDFFRRQAEGGGAFAVHRDADLAIAAGGFGAYVRQALEATGGDRKS